MFEKNLRVSVVGCTFTFRTSVRIPGTFADRKARTMATMTLNAGSIGSQNPYKSTKSLLTARGRFVARLAVVVSFVVLGVAGYSAVGSSEVSAPAATSYVEIVVTPGQTLWNIASQVSGGVDIPGMVEEIVSLNSLNSPEVAAGQHIYVPAK
jgi:hypothetical protein